MALLVAGGALAAAAAWQALAQAGNEAAPAATPPGNQAEVAREETPAAPAAAVQPAARPVLSGRVTPMTERVATLGVLNKRNGLYRDLTLKPGQAVRIGDLVVRLRACETTAPWETEKMTGAFVQVIVQDSDEKWRKYFSGWLFKETPSINVVEHPIYDVWTKACAMKHPEMGVDTLVVRANEGSSAAARRSSAPKSPAPSAEPPVVGNAADSSAI